MAGFHNSRADALELLSTGIANTDVDALERMAMSLAADKVEFGRATTPTDQAIELAKAVSNKG